jgi:hypothetical protein
MDYKIGVIGRWSQNLILVFLAIIVNMSPIKIIITEIILFVKYFEDLFEKRAFLL